MIRFFKTPFVFRYLFSKREWGFSNSTDVYLTFDDGPTEELTAWILDFLKKENIQATFFCVGENAEKQPHSMRDMIADGHSIGNHTMNHIKGVNRSKREYRDSIENAGSFINSDLFRPPYGRMSVKHEKSISEKYRIIMWSWLSYDFDHSVSIDKILKKAKKQIKGGEIIVLHDNLKVQERLKELLPALVRIIREKNLSFKIIEQKTIS